MTFLLDTNIWLERMLDQERAAEVGDLLSRVPSDQLCLTDFSLHSIGVILFRLKQPGVFVQFVEDILIYGAVRLLTVPASATAELIDAAEKYGLDFDDAYQYTAAVRHGVQIISLDAHFDLTDRGRWSPAELLERIDSETHN